MQSQMKRYSIPGPDQTAGQFRFRQSGASFHLLPSSCRGRDHGRRRAFVRALPKASRLPRDFSSPSLLSGYAVNLLNVFTTETDQLTRLLPSHKTR